MTGTPWLTVDGRSPIRQLGRYGISIEDREGTLYNQIRFCSEDHLETCGLSYYSLADLGLPHGSKTPDIFNAAIERGAKIVPNNIALLTLIQHPNAFQNGFFKRLLRRNVPFESCLLGIKPLTGHSGRKYVVELAEKHFRFRLAEEDERWPDYEYWIFAS